MRALSLVLTAFIFAGLTALSCRSWKSYPPLPTVEKVDLDRYAGLWYELARLPNSFEKGLVCVSARYTRGERGTIAVLNSGIVDTDRTIKKTARGKARVPDQSAPGKLEVSFFGPFYGDYWILELDQDTYRYALVGIPSRKYLWILSRTKTLPDAIYNSLVSSAREKGFDTERLIKVDQSCP